MALYPMASALSTHAEQQTSEPAKKTTRKRVRPVPTRPNGIEINFYRLLMRLAERDGYAHAGFAKLGAMFKTEKGKPRGERMIQNYINHLRQFGFIKTLKEPVHQKLFIWCLVPDPPTVEDYRPTPPPDFVVFDAMASPVVSGVDSPVISPLLQYKNLETGDNSMEQQQYKRETLKPMLGYVTKPPVVVKVDISKLSVPERDIFTAIRAAMPDIHKGNDAALVAMIQQYTVPVCLHRLAEWKQKPGRGPGFYLDSLRFEWTQGKNSPATAPNQRVSAQTATGGTERKEKAFDWLSELKAETERRRALGLPIEVPKDRKQKDRGDRGGAGSFTKGKWANV